MDSTQVEEIWVNVREGAEITGYHRDHVQRLARNNLNLPDDKREIKVRLRSNGYDIWLPDLLKYVEAVGRGPRKKSEQTT